MTLFCFYSNYCVESYNLYLLKLVIPTYVYSISVEYISGIYLSNIFVEYICQIYVSNICAEYCG